MKREFYCSICQEFHIGTITEVFTNRVHDIAKIVCEKCKEEATIYLPANTIPKITVEVKEAA